MKRLFKTLFLWIPGVLLLLYTFTGFWLIPTIVEKMMPQLIRESLGAEMTMHQMTFNPYTMALTISDFHLKDPKGNDLFRLETMVLDFDPLSSLLHRTFYFGDIRFVHPLLHIVVDKEGSVNVAHLLPPPDEAESEKNSSHKTPGTESKPKGLPPFHIREFEIESFRLKFEDYSRPHPVKIATNPYTFTLTDLSTKRHAKSRLDFRLTTKEGGAIEISSGFSVKPFRVHGKATIDAFNLDTLNQYFQNVSPLRVTEGDVDFNLDFTIKMAENGFEVAFDNGMFRLRDIHLKEGNKTPMVLGDFEIDGLTMRWPARKIEVEKVALRDSHIDIEADSEGRYSFQRWFKPNTNRKRSPDKQPSGDEKSPQTAAASRLPWQIYVHEIVMNDTHTRFDGPAYSFDAAYHAKITKVHIDTSGILRADIDLLETGDIELKDKVGDTQPFRLKRMALEKGHLDTKKDRLQIDRIVIREPASKIIVYKGAETNIDRLLHARTALQREKGHAASSSDTRTDHPKPVKKFQVLVKRFDFENGTLSFEDRRFSPPVKLAGEAMTLHVEKLQVPQKTPIPFKTSMRLPGNASLTAEGEVAMKPMRVHLTTEAHHLALQPYLPIVRQFFNLDIPKGYIDGNATVVYDETASPRGSVVFNTALSDLSILHGSSHEKIFGLERVAIEPGRMEFSPNALLIERLLIEKPTFNIHINKDRTSNLDHILKKPLRTDQQAKDQTTEKPADQEKTESPSLDFAVAHILVREGGGDFADESLTIPFSTSIHDMNGDLIGLNNKDGNVAGARFSGVIGRYGMMRAKSLFISSDPRQDTEIAVAFRNLDITKVSPYISKYLGYEIVDGRLWVRIDYEIVDGRLKSKNSIVIRRLKLGKEIDSNVSVGKSVKFALSLLTDSQGNIDLDIPIEGNVTNPNVNLGGVILKALTHVVTKVVEAPFKILGKMLGISGAALQYVHFDPGSSEIEPTEKETLDTLAKVLPKKPEMVLMIPGIYEKVADTRALKKRKLRNYLIERLRNETRKSIQSAMQSGSLLEKIYRQRAGEKALSKFKETETRAGTFDPKRYIQHLYDAVLETFPVETKELSALANDRSKQVFAYLVKAGVPKRQLKRADAVKVDKLDETGMIPLKLGMERKDEKKK